MVRLFQICVTCNHTRKFAQGQRNCQPCANRLAEERRIKPRRYIHMNDIHSSSSALLSSHIPTRAHPLLVPGSAGELCIRQNSSSKSTLLVSTSTIISPDLFLTHASNNFDHYCCFTTHGFV